MITTYYIYSIIIPALLPVFIILWYVYKQDKADKEPKKLLLKVFIFGALSCFPCIPLEMLAEKILQSLYSQETMTYIWKTNLYGVALVEEFAKWLIFMIIIWNNENFDYYYDAIVYAVTISLGFAGLENIFYVIRFGRNVILLRALLSIPGHATFAIFMGFFLARAKGFAYKNKNVIKILLLIVSLAIPSFIHGVYDFLCSINIGGLVFVVFLVYVIAIDLLAWKTLKHCFTTDSPLYQISNPEHEIDKN